MNLSVQFIHAFARERVVIGQETGIRLIVGIHVGSTRDKQLDAPVQKEQFSQVRGCEGAQARGAAQRGRAPWRTQFVGPSWKIAGDYGVGSLRTASLVPSRESSGTHPLRPVVFE